MAKKATVKKALDYSAQVNQWLEHDSHPPATEDEIKPYFDCGYLPCTTGFMIVKDREERL